MFPINPKPGDTHLSFVWNGERWACGGNGGGGGGGAGGTYIGPNPPAAPVLGQMWLDSSNGQLYVFDGTQWLAAAPSGVNVSATAPTSPSAGDFWFNTADSNLYVFDGTSWVLSSNVPPTVISDTAPASPFAGELWHNTTDNALYVYDGSTSTWILAHPLSTVSGPNPPANPSPGDMWWSTADDEMSIYDGTNWVAMIATPSLGSIAYAQPTAPDNPSVGELWFDTANNELFIWDGSAWQEAHGISGPQGVPGPIGPPGASFPDAPSDGKWYGRLNGTWSSGGGTISGSTVFNPAGVTLPVGAVPVAIGGWENDVSLFVQSDSSDYATEYTRCIQCDILGDAQTYLEMTINTGATLLGAINVQPGLTGVLYTSASDARLKTHQKEIANSGDLVDAIAPIEFHWKGKPHGPLCHGIAAQDLHRVFPEAVREGRGNPGDKDFKPWATDTSKLVPILLAEIKDLRKRLAKLEGRK